MWLKILSHVVENFGITNCPFKELGKQEQAFGLLVNKA
jgi:hypothetical protein